MVQRGIDRPRYSNLESEKMEHSQPAGSQKNKLNAGRTLEQTGVQASIKDGRIK